MLVSIKSSKLICSMVESCYGLVLWYRSWKFKEARVSTNIKMFPEAVKHSFFCCCFILLVFFPEKTV